MISKLYLLLTIIKSFSLFDYVVGYVALHIGEECKNDKECTEKDPNSFCALYSERLLCICKTDYHIYIVNNTEKCIYSNIGEEEKEGLTAAPVILCFLFCVMVEAFCLLAFRYWKKHRRSTVTRHGALHLQTVTLSDFTRFSHRNDPVSFTITPERESINSSTLLSSPPSYCQTVIVGINMNSQKEEPPPPYEEAIKKNVKSTVLSDEYNHRKMSC